MKIIHGIELRSGSKEEIMPDYSLDFPYISSRVELDRFIGRCSPWHWHKEVELFYMVHGELEYETPRGKLLFPTGSGGFVNSNVLHMSRAVSGETPVTSFLHLFHPVLISGHSSSVIDRKYVTPLVTDSGAEIIGLFPDHREHAPLLDMLRQSFQLSETDYGYEIRLRSVLGDMWCRLLKLSESSRAADGVGGRTSGNAKMMMAFIHKHCGEKLSVAQIAAAAFISERECFRVFRDCLHMTPLEYLTSYRIQRACYELAETDHTITSICQNCGLGSSSYFAHIFLRKMGCSPKQYRAQWRDRDKI